MIIGSANFKLKLEEFQKAGSISPSNQTEEKVFWLVNKWISGVKRFTFRTSGSTGTPKEYQIHRDKIVMSAKSTFKTIDPTKNFKNALLCINPDFIGGAMVVFRALIMDLDLYIIEPSGEIMQHLPAAFKTDLVSMAPLQFKKLSTKDLDKFRTILVGGAPLDQLSKPNTHCKIYATYGMTETVSHVALREINEPDFRTIGDIQVSLNTDQCLQFYGEITDHKWLITNDIGEVYSNYSFRWLGRKDLMINSGGIKLNPETIESKLADQLKGIQFIVSSLPDDELGEKVVLILDSKPEKELNFESLQRYEKPKQIFYGQKIPMTSSGKIDRIKTKRILQAS